MSYIKNPIEIFPERKERINRGPRKRIFTLPEAANKTMAIIDLRKTSKETNRVRENEYKWDEWDVGGDKGQERRQNKVGKPRTFLLQF